MVRNFKITLNWNGPGGDPSSVPDKALIYMVLSAKLNEKGEYMTGTYKVLDMGQTGEGETRLSDHDRKDCWEEKTPNSHTLGYKYALMPSKEYDKTDRLIVECCLRANTNPACGTECNKGYNRDDIVSIINTGNYKPLKSSYLCKK